MASMQSFEIVAPNCAGLDIGSETHYACIPEDRPEPRVRSFGSFTSDLHEMGRWLASSGVEKVFMESTGSYWYQVFEVLESHGLDVVVVDARQSARQPGRKKTDVLDCQWLQKLGSCGLLNPCFVASTGDLRTYHRHRQSLIESASQQVLRMQRALTEMNVQLHHALSDIMGVSGRSILKAILAGERDPERLADLCDKRVKAKRETVIKALEGNWSDSRLFVLRHAYDSYCQIEGRIAEVEAEIAKVLASMAGSEAEPQARPSRKKGQYRFEIEKELSQVFGTDLTKVDGFDTPTVITLLSECGTDLSLFPSAKHFASWLGLSPNNRITGGKIRSSKTKDVRSRASLAFRLAARSLLRSECYLGAFLRSIAARRGKAKAIIATARKLAVIYFSLVTRGEAYEPKSAAEYEQAHRDRSLRNLRKRAAHLGMALVEVNTGEVQVC
jgi:transposase